MANAIEEIEIERRASEKQKIAQECKTSQYRVNKILVSDIKSIDYNSDIKYKGSEKSERDSRKRTSFEVASDLASARSIRASV